MPTVLAADVNFPKPLKDMLFCHLKRKCAAIVFIVYVTMSAMKPKEKPMFKVYVESSYVGDASSPSEGLTLAKEMAYRLGYSGGNIQVKIFNEHNQVVQRAGIYVANT